MDKLLKDLSLDLDKHNPYSEGVDAGYGAWEAGARWVISHIQDTRRKEELAKVESEEAVEQKLAEEAHE